MHKQRNSPFRAIAFAVLLFGLTHFSVDALSSSVPLGQPGLSFRYVQTFGETGVAYLPDPQHRYLNGPYGIDVDTSGNLWVAELDGSTAIQYAPDGSFLQLIGTPGTQSQSDESHFATMFDVAVDPTGNLWVIDSGCGYFMKYTAGGAYLSRLGNCERGSENNQFNWPAGVAFDSASRIYIADTGNFRVQVFDSDGVYSATLGVTGVAGADNSHFSSPQHIFIDSADHLYVADAINHRVQVFDERHAYVGTLGVTGESGTDSGHLNNPNGVVADATRIYVADSGNNRVQVFDKATLGYQATLGQGPGNYAFNQPADVALDAAGNLFVADYMNYRVQKFNSDLTYLQTFGVTGVPYLTDGYHINGPFDVAVDGTGLVAVVEGWFNGHRVIVFGPSGIPQFTLGEAGVPGGDNTHFNNPHGAVFDAAGDLYVGDCGNNRVQVYNSNGTYQQTLGIGYGQGNYQFNCPGKLTFDASGRLYVADENNHRVQVFDRDLYYVATLGVTGQPGSGNDHLNYPVDVEVDPAGNLYVADADNHRVQVFDSSHAYVRTLGVTGECGDAFDHFCRPFGIARDQAGNLYVSDWNNNRVQVFDPAGAYLTTLGGANGTLSGQLRYPSGVDVDAGGNVYVADLNNNRVQKFAPGVPGWVQRNVNGMGDKQNQGVSTVDVFGGVLYAGTTNWQSGARMWRSDDGRAWSPISAPGFGGGNANPALLDVVVFDGQLYAATGDVWNNPTNITARLWRSSNGTTWEPVIDAGFGDTANTGVNSLAVFNNLLYAVAVNPSAGLQIWRSSTGDATDWTRVISAGFDSPSHTGYSTGLIVFNGYLYAGVEDGANGAAVWRTADGTDWDKVNASGFGDPRNIEIGGKAVFNGYLYLGSRNNSTGGQVWRSSNGTDWQPVVGNGFGNGRNSKVDALAVVNWALYAVSFNDDTGMTVWRSVDGVAWSPANPDGFGDSNNMTTHWTNANAVYNGHFYLGTWNSAHGGELWAMTGFPVFIPLVSNPTATNLGYSEQ